MWANVIDVCTFVCAQSQAVSLCIHPSTSLLCPCLLMLYEEAGDEGVALNLS